MLKYKGCWFGRKTITGFKNIAQFILFDRVWNILLNSSSAYIVFEQEKGFGSGAVFNLKCPLTGVLDV